MKSCLLKSLLGTACLAVAQAYADFDWYAGKLADTLPIDAALAPVWQGSQGKLKLTLPLGKLRPGDRYLEALLEHSISGDPANLTWEAEILPLAEGAELLFSASAASQPRTLLRFDARESGAGMLRVRLLNGHQIVDTVQAPFTVEPVQPLSEHPPAAVQIDAPHPAGGDTQAWLTFGMPMPRGALWDVSGLQLRDAGGKVVAAQFHPTARWAPGGSYKWLRVDAFTASAGPLKVVADAPPRPLAETLTIDHDGQAISVDTGPANYRIEPHGALLNKIDLHGKPVSTYHSQAPGMFAVDQHGRLARPDARDTILTIELQTAGVTRIRATGSYRTADGEALAHFNVWFEFAAGRPECRITHQFIISRDSNEVWFTELGWEFGFMDWQPDSALFAAPRQQPGTMEAIPLDGSTVQWVQSEHRRYGGGEDRFQLWLADQLDTEFDGEMGDWAAALGGDKGLWLGCRESARQHPKAFRITRDSLTLDLFHGGTGETLDFRAPSLVERWNQGNRLGDELAETTRATETNAIGWSKTHFLEIAPVSNRRQAEAAGHSFTFAPTALPDPWWTYHSRVVGPLYPRDTTRFPQAEAFIDDAFGYWQEEQEYLGEYGFVDFFTGPHHTRSFPQSQGRFRASYTLRNAFWLLYLRSGEAKFREMATWSNRVYLDSYLASWDGPRRIRGLYLHAVGPQDPHASLPFYWEGFTRPGFGTHSNLDQFLLDYYVTGNPRARMGVLEYAEGVKRWWAQSQSDWRILAVLRAVNRAYALDWDPELRLIQAEILNQVYDPDSPVFLTAKGRPYQSSTYKTQEDIAGLIEGWELYGTARYHNIATAVSDYWWRSMLPGPRFEKGRSGSFLWRQNPDPALAGQLWDAVRTESVQSVETNSAATVFRFQGIPYALDVVAASDADRSPITARAGAEILSGQGGLLLRKAGDENLEAHLRLQRDGLRGLPVIQPLPPVSQIGLRLVTLETGYNEVVRLQLPGESEDSDYWIGLPETGGHQAYLNRPAPFMLFADGWWRPVPEAQNPPAKIFFQVPEGALDASIRFEREARLFAPDGSPWPDAQPVRGRVDFPDGQSGAWHFTSASGSAVRLRNLPPLFSFERPDGLFAVDLDTLPLPPVEKISAMPGFFLAEGETLRIEPSATALPFQEGTIEFFFRPHWDSFDFGQGRTIKRLLRIETDGNRNSSLRYVVDPNRAGWPGNPWSQSHVLEMEMETEGPARPRAIRVRRTIFEEGEWVHVAIVWGQRMFGHSGVRTQPAFEIKLFVNGSAGKTVTWPRQGNQAAWQPLAVVFGPSFEGEIAGLRISAGQRYSADFPLPQRSRIEPDDDTLFYFPFSENTVGLETIGGTRIEAITDQP